MEVDNIWKKARKEINEMVWKMDFLNPDISRYKICSLVRVRTIQKSR